MPDNAIEEHVLRNLLADLGNDRDTLGELVATFVTEAPQLIHDAREAAHGGDIATCQRAVHTLKSTSATFGAMRLSVCCKQLEKQARSGHVPTDEAFARLDELWHAVRQELASAAA